MFHLLLNIYLYIGTLNINRFGITYQIKYKIVLKRAYYVIQDKHVANHLGVLHKCILTKPNALVYYTLSRFGRNPKSLMWLIY